MGRLPIIALPLEKLNDPKPPSRQTSLLGDYYRFQLDNFENDFGNILFVQHSIAIVVPSVKIRLWTIWREVCSMMSKVLPIAFESVFWCRINVQATQQQNNRYAQSFHNTVHEL